MHKFHIPVMGIGYSIDTPVKVAHLGISSVISLLDDFLLEKMRAHYCSLYQLPYTEITTKDIDYRALRTTAYLDLMDYIVAKKFDDLKNKAATSGSELEKYIQLLPSSSPLREKFALYKSNPTLHQETLKQILSSIQPGCIDVNIMTRLDKFNTANGETLPVEYNDAHASFKGFAKSKLTSSIVLSSGMNPRLFDFMDKFDDFFADEHGHFRKKIILKVSDYRSALIQGKFLAKKGLWVSEYRIESGLNCGGHAFPTQGHLMGPILAEFKNKKQELIQSIYELWTSVLVKQNRVFPDKAPEVKITAQGGIGTHEEHEFFLNYYEIDAIGWGSPFLLVPEVSNVDKLTLDLLSQAKENDVYLSNTSPLGVPFNTLKGNTKDKEKLEWIKNNKPGSPCPKKYGAINAERMCTGSRQYQRMKIKELDAMNLSPEEYKKEYDKITVKTCICVGLGTSALLVNDLDITIEGDAVSVCPGPNIAFFNKIVSLQEMVDHIYGRTNIISRTDRPHVFINELELYVNYFKDETLIYSENKTTKQHDYLKIFRDNLLDGIHYYQSLLENKNIELIGMEREKLDAYQELLRNIVLEPC